MKIETTVNKLMLLLDPQEAREVGIILLRAARDVKKGSPRAGRNVAGVAETKTHNLPAVLSILVEPTSPKSPNQLRKDSK